MQHKLPKTLPSFIWFFLRPNRIMAVIFVFLAILAGFWGPLNSLLIKHIINALPQVQGGGISILTWPLALIVLNFVLFDNVTWRTIGFITYKFKPITQNRILEATLDYTLANSHGYFQDNLSGRIANQVMTLATNITEILYEISQDFIRGASLIIITFAAAYNVNPSFFYILLVWAIAFSTFSILMSRKLVQLADTHAQAESLVSGQMVDTIANHNNVRIFSQKDYELSRTKGFLLKLQQAFQKKELFNIVLNTVQGGLIAIMMGAAAYFLAVLYGQNLITVGDFALILGLSMELGHMLWHTMWRVDGFNEAVGKCKQSLSALIVPHDIIDQSNAKELKAPHGQITFENVAFQYKGTDVIFKNKSITIKSGQKVGLVGYSGSGKSTFVNLILRLFDVTNGRILIDGQNIGEVTQDSLRHNIALIPQDPSLFHRTLMENIRYGRSNATDNEVLEAAKKAHADAFINKLTHGYTSLVGERGIKLSGGQRQRIAIARALLKQAPILILDEATSQLDSVTESDIQDSLQELMKNKTTLIIAHRLSTLLHMNRIIVFDQGKIVQDGSHTELLAKGGLYKTLWDAQVGGFLPEIRTSNA